MMDSLGNCIFIGSLLTYVSAVHLSIVPEKVLLGETVKVDCTYGGVLHGKWPYNVIINGVNIILYKLKRTPGFSYNRSVDDWSRETTFTLCHSNIQANDNGTTYQCQLVANGRIYTSNIGTVLIDNAPDTLGSLIIVPNTAVHTTSLSNQSQTGNLHLTAMYGVSIISLDTKTPEVSVRNHNEIDGEVNNGDFVLLFTGVACGVIGTVVMLAIGAAVIAVSAKCYYRQRGDSPNQVQGSENISKHSRETGNDSIEDAGDTTLSPSQEETPPLQVTEDDSEYTHSVCKNPAYIPLEILQSIKRDHLECVNHSRGVYENT